MIAARIGVRAVGRLPSFRCQGPPGCGLAAQALADRRANGPHARAGDAAGGPRITEIPPSVES
jgi:hypothetical protein